MEVNLDVYIRNLRIFYQQLIKEHKKEKQLSAGFKALVQNENRKWSRALGFKRQAGQGRGENRGLSKMKDQRMGKTKIAVDAVFVSEKIQHLVAFGYCYLMLQYKNTAAFSFLSSKLARILQKKVVFNDTMVRRITYFWEKLQEVVSGKRKLIRFQKILQDGFADMPPNLLDVLYQIILQEKQLKNMNIPKYLEELSAFLSMRIDFFSINEDDSIKTYTFGKDFSVAMRFGFFKKEKFYGYVSKLPKKQSPLLDTTFERFGLIAQNLSQMYSGSMKQYLALTNIKGQSRLSRANSIISTTSISPLQSYSQSNQSQYEHI